MRWSRHHTDTSLGELMDPHPDATDTPSTLSTTGSESDEDTRVRLWPGDYTGETATAEPTTAEPDDDVADASASFLDDEDYLPQERRGLGRLTIALVAALVLAVGVLGGVWVEKQLGSSSAAASGLPAGMPSGQGFPGAGGGAGAPGGAASGASGGGAGSGGGSTTSTTPAVVGTVSSTTAKSLVVTDLGGTKHTVTVTSSTTVTTPYGHGSLETGDTVAVSGSTGSDGSVAATGVTVS
jgi:hypothetical protein